MSTSPGALFVGTIGVKHMSNYNKIKSRITALTFEDPEQLLAHPSNARIHPRFQRKALDKQMQRIGWVQTVIVNDQTSRMLDGHLRVAIAMQHDEPTVPVLHVDVSEDEERAILRSFDALGDLAAYDDQKLLDLDADLSAVPDLADLLDGLDSPSSKDEDKSQEPPMFQVVVTCTDEADQVNLGEQLSAEGRTVNLKTKGG